MIRRVSLDTVNLERGGQEMKTRVLNVIFIMMVSLCMVVPAGRVQAEEPIVIGCPLSTAYLYGWDAERAATLAIEEINAAGGVDVGGGRSGPSRSRSSTRGISSRACRSRTPFLRWKN